MAERRVNLAQARNDLSALIEEVQETGERVTITKHGRSAVAILSKEDYESIVTTYELLTSTSKKSDPPKVVEVPDHPDIRLISNEELVAELLRRLGQK